MPSVDPRFLTSSGREVFIGNELLVKGCLETEGGVHLYTGYPGSPVAGFFDCLGDIAPLVKKHGIRAFQANNEALGVAALNGSQMMPFRSVVAFKSVGLHVAADALALGNLAGAHPQGGAVVICGDDPWCDSTQVPADSRFLCEHLRMPVVEPGSVQEVKDWVALSFKLSQVAGLYIGYVVTTAQADGGGTVECAPNHFPEINTNQRVALETAKINLNKVLLPPRTWQEELRMPARHAATIVRARELGINQIIPAERVVSGQLPVASEDTSTGNWQPTTGNSPLGFMTTGMARPYLEHVLSDLGLLGCFPILNMGMSYPVDVELVREFSNTCRQMIVIEERRSFLEKGIRDGLFKALPGKTDLIPNAEAADITSRIFGKNFPRNLPGIPEGRGLNPSALAQLLIPLFKATEDIAPELRNGRLSAELDLIRKVSKQKLEVLGNATAAVVDQLSEKIIARTPTFCPGCPHRDSSAVLLEVRELFKDEKYMKRVHHRAPVDMVAHGDTGCYTMLMFAPTEQLMHNYSGMGLGAGTGSGIDAFITNKQIVFMGDGTFYHSGQVAISNAVQTGQDLTFIILENGTTAMTGHQEHAGTHVDLLGNPTFVQDIYSIVAAMKGTSRLSVEKVNPADRDQWKKALERTILKDGVKVLIADKECGITYYRTKGKQERKTAREHGGYLPTKTHMNITPEVCEGCLECTKATACPGLTTIDTDYGRKIDTDLTLCVNDGACERVRTSNEIADSVKPCPSFEQVTIIRKKRKRYTLPNLGLDQLPDPINVHDMTQPGSSWRVHMAGVGGMGIGVAGAILVRAGHRQGLKVVFSDKKGLAIRNGGVYSQICYVNDGSEGQVIRGKGQVDERADSGERSMPDHSRGPHASSGNASSAHGLSASSESAQPSRTTGILPVSSDDAKNAHGRDARGTPAISTTGLIPFGKADLLLGIDILEAARAIDPREQFRIATADRTSAVLNLFKQPTVYTLLGKQDFDPEKLREEIFSRVNPEHSYAKNLSQLCEERLGSKQFVNIMMLGVAYQLGLIPVSASAIAWAIRDTIRRDQRRNIKAFNIGRKLALEPRALPNRPEPVTWQQLVTNKGRILRKSMRKGDHTANDLEKLVKGAVESMPSLPAKSHYDLAVRVYDLLMYENVEYAKRFIDGVRKVYARDSIERNYDATSAAIWGLAKVMLIKDEPYVSYLLTRPEKKQRDMAKFGVDPLNGDRIVYRHHTSPEFPIGPWRLRLKITTSDWQLKIVSKCKFLRKLPAWHRKEKTFRDWYEGLVDRINLTDREHYEQSVKALKRLDDVSGYREVRYPKMNRMQTEVEAVMTEAPSMIANDTVAPAVGVQSMSHA